MKIDIEERKIRVEMTPLLDIVFLLLVFFIYAMLSMAINRGMIMQLPESSTSHINDQESQIAVNILENGDIFINNTKTTIEGLPDLISNLANGIPNEQKTIQVFGDANISYQRLFDVLDAIRRSNLYRISLQTASKKQVK